MDAHLGQLVPMCLLEVQYFNNRFFSFSIQFFRIMRTSFRKCPVATVHEKLIATLSQKDRALRGPWDIPNGFLKGQRKPRKSGLFLRTILPATGRS